MLKFFLIKKKIEAFYQLQLSNFMKIHNIFVTSVLKVHRIKIYIILKNDAQRQACLSKKKRQDQINSKCSRHEHYE